MAATMPIRVLLVEDSVDDARLIVRELARGGYSPRHRRVDTAEAMSAALDEETWDVVIADYLVPGFGGLAALRMVHERDLDLPFILTSGVIGEDVAVEAMRAGADDYVMKRSLARLPLAVGRELKEAAIRRERREAEDALRHHLLFMRTLSESLGEGVLAVDGRGRITFTNPAGRSILGARERELEGRDVGEVILSDGGQAGVSAGAGAVLESVVAQAPVRRNDAFFRRCDSTLVPVAYVAAPLRSDLGPAEGAVITFADMRERKRAERAERFLVEASAALAEPIDLDATIARVATLVIPEFADACAVAVAEDVDTIYEVTALARDDGGALVATRRREPGGHEERAGHRPLREVDRFASIPRAPDELLDALAIEPAQRALFERDAPWSCTLAPLGGRGRTVGGIAFLTARGRREREPVDLRVAQNYAHRAGLAVDNALLHREAQRAIAAREDFLTIASHELRTPLSTLRIVVQSLLERGLAPPGLRPGAQEAEGHAPEVESPDRAALRMIARQVERLGQLVSELLDVSRIVAGRVKLEREKVDVAGLVREVSDRAEPEARRISSPITVDAPAPVVGRWDRLRLEQAIACSRTRSSTAPASRWSSARTSSTSGTR
jgi:PAS domain S-box-containing protein